MKEQIEILEADVKRLQKEIAEAYAEVNDSRSVICNLENEVSEWKRRAESSQKARTQFEKEVAELEAENVDKQDWRRTAEFYMKAMLKAQAERDVIEEKRREDIAQCIELLKDVLWQACGVGDWEEGKGGPICTKGLSAYEDACEYLTKRGHLRMYGRVTGRLLETKDEK
jgi:hypothetical protein